MNAYSLIQESINNTIRNRRRTARMNSENEFTSSLYDLSDFIYTTLTSISSDIEVLNVPGTYENEGERTSSLSVKDLNASSTVELYDSEKEYKYTDTTCCICTASYIDKESIIRILDCNHKFCLSCIDYWLASSTKCPMCKLELQKT
jgi:hypothetical protein